MNCIGTHCEEKSILQARKACPLQFKAKIEPKKENAVWCTSWQDIQGTIHYEILKPNDKINSRGYCNKMDDLNEAVKETSNFQ